MNQLISKLYLKYEDDIKTYQHLRAVTNVRSTDIAAVTSELLSHQRRERLVTETDVVELAHDLQGREVGVEVELVGSIGAVEDKVEGERELLVPVLLLGDHKLLGTHLHGIVLLVRAVREHVDVGTKRDSPEDGEVTETAHADDSDVLAWAGAKADEWAVHGETGTHHWCRHGGLDVVGDLKGEVLVGADVRGVATLSDGAILVGCAVGVDGWRTSVNCSMW